MVFEAFFFFFFHQGFKRKCWRSSKLRESTRGHISVLFQGPGNIKLRERLCIGARVSACVRNADEEKSTGVSMKRLSLIADEREARVRISGRQTCVCLLAKVGRRTKMRGDVSACPRTHVCTLADADRQSREAHSSLK